MSPPDPEALAAGPQAARPSAVAMGRRPVVTWVLLAVNLLVFLVEIPGGTRSAGNLLDLGAMLAPASWLGHQWWRLLTAGFLHHGPIHLALNAFALLVFGTDLERRIGRGRFAACYLVSGPAAMAFLLGMDTWLHTGAQLVVGASASVMGVVGATLAVLALDWRRQGTRAPAWELPALVGIVVLEILSDAVTPQVSLLGHAGGLAAGIVLGLLLAPARPPVGAPASAEPLR